MHDCLPHEGDSPDLGEGAIARYATLWLTYTSCPGPRETRDINPSYPTHDLVRPPIAPSHGTGNEEALAILIGGRLWAGTSWPRGVYGTLAKDVRNNHLGGNSYTGAAVVSFEPHAMTLSRESSRRVITEEEAAREAWDYTWIGTRTTMFSMRTMYIWSQSQLSANLSASLLRNTWTGWNRGAFRATRILRMTIPPDCLRTDRQMMGHMVTVRMNTRKPLKQAPGARCGRPAPRTRDLRPKESYPAPTKERGKPQHALDHALIAFGA
jgi:hypothetical protein